MTVLEIPITLKPEATSVMSSVHIVAGLQSFCTRNDHQNCMNWQLSVSQGSLLLNKATVFLQFPTLAFMLYMQFQEMRYVTIWLNNASGYDHRGALIEIHSGGIVLSLLYKWPRINYHENICKGLDPSLVWLVNLYLQCTNTLEVYASVLIWFISWKLFIPR